MIRFIIADEAGEDCTATNPHWSTDFCNDCECPALTQGNKSNSEFRSVSLSQNQTTKFYQFLHKILKGL